MARQLVLGTYVTMPSTREVQILAESGLDFVRFDPFKFTWNTATMAEMVAATREVSMTPWARTSHDAGMITKMVSLGMQIITVPEVDTEAQARDIVAAVRRSQNAGPGRNAGDAEVLVGVQIETAEGIANCRQIIATDGVDIVHTGRNDISRALGVPGEQFHPRVLDVERRIVESVLEARKQMSLLYPLTEQGIELATNYLRMGVRIFALDMDYRVLHRVFRQFVDLLRTADRNEFGGCHGD